MSPDASAPPPDPCTTLAWIFAFIGSFDEVIVTAFIAGTCETVPKRMFNELILQINPTITAVATLMIDMTVLALAAVALLLRRAAPRQPPASRRSARLSALR